MIQRTACLVANSTDPYRNQAIEKHLLDTLPDNTAILYLWQNRRTMMIGRMQNAWYECRAGELKQSGGSVARRLSGGGADYQDEGCVGATMLLPKTEWDLSRQLSVLGMAVGVFGVQAQTVGRCGLGAGGGRFCTNAYFKGGAKAMHQATLLVKCSLGALAQLTDVEEGKLPQGLRRPPVSRTNLNDLCGEITPSALCEALYWAFARVYGSQPAMLDERMLDSASLEALTARFASQEWLFPQSIPYTFSVAERFPWGGVEVQLMAEGGVIRTARIHTDAMEIPLFAEMERVLTGAPFLISAISGRFSQRLAWLGAPGLNQMMGDVCTLICGRIREMDRSGGL